MDFKSIFISRGEAAEALQLCLRGSGPEAEHGWGRRQLPLCGLGLSREHKTASCRCAEAWLSEAPAELSGGIPGETGH